jgi:beta-mannosidase
VYVPSSPCRGELPFHVDRGPSHYYGVGPYLRPLSDATTCGVRFASECLGFSQPPHPRDGGDPEALPELPVPRDPGADWDFMDVTRHYAAVLYQVPVEAPVRDRQTASRLALTPAVVAAHLAHTLRRAGSGCRGMLVWWLRDRQWGAGWGLIDGRGRPKPAFRTLARAWAPRALWFEDRGLNGLAVHLVNERPEPLAGELHVELFNARGVPIERARRSLRLGPRDGATLGVEALLGHFADPTHAYRFGPPEHQLVHARLVAPGADADAPAACSATHLPLGPGQPWVEQVPVRAEIEMDGRIARLRLTAEGFAESVAVDAGSAACSDDFFHLAPGRPHEIAIEAGDAALPATVELWPLNARRPTRVDL